jgi:REP element-mobilizing transposase RayT
MNRGDRREAIFRDEKDPDLFLKTLGECCTRSAFRVHAYCLMPNHFHLVLETPRGNLTSGMQWFLGTYSARFNRKHKYFGHVFSGRYKAVLISRSSGYLRAACHYVHLNPARARLLRPDQPLEAFRWSSYPAYIGPRRGRPAWLRTDRFLAELHLTADTPATRQRLREHMERWRAAEDQSEYKAFRRGWFAGPTEEKRELLEIIEANKTSAHYGEELRESDLLHAERMLREQLRDRGLTVQASVQASVLTFYTTALNGFTTHDCTPGFVHSLRWSKRVTPAKALEARKIEVIGVEFGLVFNGQSSQVRVCGERSPGNGRRVERNSARCRRIGVQNEHSGLLQPGIHAI